MSFSFCNHFAPKCCAAPRYVVRRDCQRANGRIEVSTHNLQTQFIYAYLSLLQRPATFYSKKSSSASRFLLLQSRKFPKSENQEFAMSKRTMPGGTWPACRYANIFEGLVMGLSVFCLAMSIVSGVQIMKSTGIPNPRQKDHRSIV